MLQDASRQTGRTSGDFRVALVTGGLKLGGSTTFLCNLGGELVRRNIPVEVLSFEAENPLEPDFQRSNVKVLCQDDKAVIFEDRLVAILDELRRFKPTVVVAALSAISFEVLRYLPEGVVRVGMIQSDDPGVYNMTRFYRSHVDLMVGVSRTIVEKLRGMAEFDGVATACLPYGVMIPDWIARKPEGNTPLRILYLGRLIREQKRVELFPKILAGLEKSGIPFHWTIAGDGPDSGWLRERMAEGVARKTVSFTGSIPNSQVPALLARQDIFLLTSDYEGLPLALLEAMGSGLVPVVSDLRSGISEVVNETNGRRVATDHVEGYAEEILWLHGHPEDFARLSRNARETAMSEYSIEAMANRWLKALPAASTIGPWPDRWDIQRPLMLKNTFRFTGPGRILKRLALKFQSRRN